MRFCGRVLPQALLALALAAATAHADPGDVENSHDYTGFPRPAGFVITDYDEDNPAEFDFPVARPLPLDADHVEKVHVKGHRYVIRYEAGPGSATPSLFQTQQYYEKLATRAGFKIEKDGAVGDVSETFVRATAAHETWVYLEPAVTANVVTIVESPTIVSLPPPHSEAASPAAPPSISPTMDGKLHVVLAGPGTSAAPPLAPPPPLASDPNDDSLYDQLNRDGRVILPFVFKPARDELDATSQPMVDRVAAMMTRHPDLFLRIEGHTDNTGDPDSNLRLSAQRALAVQAMLIAGHVDKNRLDAVGVGGLQPLADNNTAEGREKNRRIELVLWKRNPAFHTTAPNGKNYYPNGGAASAKPGL